MTNQTVVGVIGGSGLYEIDGLKEVSSIKVETPFGEPSDELVTGFFDGVKMVFLARHGRGHRLSPTEVNYRANIYAMKKLGVSRLVSVSAVGSMREEIQPGDMVVCNQFIDHTKGRESTFFQGGIVAHVHFADPVCPALSEVLYQAGIETGARMHKDCTYIVIEGPQFSTRAESMIYRQWGVDVIGMTNLPEAKLAREAEICYAALALATDYDCWHETEEDVSVEAVLEVIEKNVAAAQNILFSALKKISLQRDCRCTQALEHVIVTDRDKIPKKIMRDLDIFLKKYLS